jgi:hypothetical protein
VAEGPEGLELPQQFDEEMLRWKRATTAVSATVKLLAAARAGAPIPRARSYTDGESEPGGELVCVCVRERVRVGFRCLCDCVFAWMLVWPCSPAHRRKGEPAYDDAMGCWDECFVRYMLSCVQTRMVCHKSPRCTACPATTALTRSRRAPTTMGVCSLAVFLLMWDLYPCYPVLLLSEYKGVLVLAAATPAHDL